MSLSAIHAFFDAERHLTGLRFVYNSDTEREMGVCVGERVADSLKKDEDTVNMDVSLGSRTRGNVFVVRTMFAGATTRCCHLIHSFQSPLSPSSKPFCLYHCTIAFRRDRLTRRLMSGSTPLKERNRAARTSVTQVLRSGRLWDVLSGTSWDRCMSCPLAPKRTVI